MVERLFVNRASIPWHQLQELIDIQTENIEL
jgi:hypothetical protein